MTANELKETDCVLLNIKVTKETATNIHDLIKQEEWEQEEGYRIILGAGLGWLRSEKYLLDSEIGDDSDARKRLVKRLMECESNLAAIRFRMFELQTANRNWELSTGSVYTENKGHRNIIDEQRGELEKLHRKIREQQAEIERLVGK